MLSDSELNRVDAIHAGANDYLLKPVSANRLGSVIKQRYTIFLLMAWEKPEGGVEIENSKNC